MAPKDQQQLFVNSNNRQIVFRIALNQKTKKQNKNWKKRKNKQQNEEEEEDTRLEWNAKWFETNRMCFELQFEIGLRFFIRSTRRSIESFFINCSVHFILSFANRKAVFYNSFSFPLSIFYFRIFYFRFSV